MDWINASNWIKVTSIFIKLFSWGWNFWHWHYQTSNKSNGFKNTCLLLIITLESEHFNGTSGNNTKEVGKLDKCTLESKSDCYFNPIPEGLQNWVFWMTKDFGDQLWFYCQPMSKSLGFRCSGSIKGSFISCKHGSTLILSKKQDIYRKKRITQGWFDRCNNNEQ